MYNLSIFTICIFISTTSFANSSKKPPIKNKSEVLIEFEERKWNIDSKKLDTGYVVIRDSSTKKIAITQLIETEPDSAIFRGSYNMVFGSLDNYLPQVYIPEADTIKSENKKQEFLAQINEGKIKRRPFILKRQGGEQILAVFNSKESAEIALKKYRRERALAKSQKTIL